MSGEEDELLLNVSADQEMEFDTEECEKLLEETPSEREARGAEEDMDVSEHWGNPSASSRTVTGGLPGCLVDDMGKEAEEDWDEGPFYLGGSRCMNLSDKKKERLRKIMKVFGPTERGFDTLADKRYESAVLRDMWAFWLKQLCIQIKPGLQRSFPMPNIDHADLFEMLINNFFPADEKQTFQFRENYEDPEEETKNDIALKLFITETLKTRIVAVNCEAKDKKDKEGNPAVMLCLGSMSGAVLFFHHPKLIPKEIKMILEDVSIQKIGSGIDTEIAQLNSIEFKLRGWVHSGAIYWTLLKDGPGQAHGLKAQLEHIKRRLSEISVRLTYTVCQKFKYFKYPWGECQDLTEGWPQTYRCLAHMRQNVRIPMALLLFAAYEYGHKCLKLEKGDSMFPIIWEIIDLTRTKVPEDLPSRDYTKPFGWGTTTIRNNDYTRHKNLADPWEIRFYRELHADFPDVQIDDEEKNSRKEIARELWERQGPGEGHLGLPDKKEWRKSPNKLLEERCSRCAKKKHVTEKEKGSCEEDSICDYPPCKDLNRQIVLHSICACPALHHFCRICFTRGHFEVSHQKAWTDRQLRHQFFKHSHRGLYTSIPYLFLFREYRPILNVTLFRGGYMNDLYQRDVITRGILNLPAGLDFGPAPKPKVRQLQKQEKEYAFREKFRLVQDNAEQLKIVLCNTIPVGLVRQRMKEFRLAQKNKTPLPVEPPVPILPKLDFESARFETWTILHKDWKLVASQPTKPVLKRKSTERVPVKERLGVPTTTTEPPTRLSAYCRLGGKVNDGDEIQVTETNAIMITRRQRKNKDKKLRRKLAKKNAKKLANY